ncbi:MAG: NADH-quinone oxidoreductase subunit I [Thermoproteus sp.]
MMSHAKLFAVAIKNLFERPWTVKWPEERRDYGPAVRGFIVNDRSKCISCQLCEAVCPAKAIKFHVEGDGKRYPGIDWGRCILCGYCVDACPTGSLQHTQHIEIIWRDLSTYRKPHEMEPQSVKAEAGSKALV